ncbi:MAG TPA: hypothetical protein G4O15_15330 [Dehalococcoidia bacterium]|nr:hypothetical protein [Dehalococcoidia bacterium]
MSIIDRIRGNPFEKLKMDELTAERIRLERIEKLKITEVNKLSETKKEVFSKGFGATEAEKRTLARQFQRLDDKIKLDDRQLKRTSDEIRVVENLIFVHENKQMLEREGLLKNLMKIPKSKLEKFLEQVNIKETILADKVDNLLATMRLEWGIQIEPINDKETQKIIDIWNDVEADPEEEFVKYEKEHSKEIDVDFG